MFRPADMFRPVGVSPAAGLVRRQPVCRAQNAATIGPELALSTVIDLKVANCAHAQPVFYGFARLAHGKGNFRQRPDAEVDHTRETLR